MLPPSSLVSLWLVTAVGFLGAVAQNDNRDGVKGVSLRTHSLNVPYMDSEMQSRWFDFGGDTVVRTDKYIRLAAARPSQSGWLFSRVPLTATNWEIEVEFMISGEASLYGDGFAIWLTKQRAQQGEVFGSVDEFEGLGVFFDTYNNHRAGTPFPYVMAMLGDGHTRYDKANDGKANELAGCSARGIRNAGQATRVRLTYFQDQSLVVELQYKGGEDDWTPCFEVPGIKIPAVTYLGFSAETGELSDNFDIIAVSTKNLYSATARAGSKGKTGAAARRQGRASKPGSGGSWGWFFLKIFFFLVACGGAYVGFTVYRSSARRGKF